MSRRGIVASGLGLVVVHCLFLCRAPALADDRQVQLRESVAAMLTDGWAVGSKALGDAAEHYETAETLAPGDARTRYGWILVLLKHRKYTDALARIDKILVRNPRHHTALQWRARIMMLKKEYPAALADLQSLARALPAADDAEARSGQPPTEQVKMAEFLGRMVGYAEGPAAMPDNLRDGVMRELETKLGDIERQAFEQARAAVVGQHAAFLQERDQVVSVAVADAERERQTELAEMDTQRSQITAEQQQIDKSRAQIRGDERQELADVSKAVRLAGGDLGRAREGLSAVVREINFARVSGNQLLLALEAQEDETQRALLQLEFNRVQLRIANLDRVARSRQLEMDRHQQRLVLLENQRAEVVNRYRGELESLSRREAGLGKQEKRLLALERKLGRAPSGRSAKGGNLATRAAAFTTYEPFPLDAERQRVLQTFD